MTEVTSYHYNILKEPRKFYQVQRLSYNISYSIATIKGRQPNHCHEYQLVVVHVGGPIIC